MGFQNLNSQLVVATNTWSLLPFCSGTKFGGFNVNLEKSTFNSDRKSGPFHHSSEFKRSGANTSLDRKSAGFLEERTCLQLACGMEIWIWETLLATNVCQREGCDWIQQRAIWESVHRLMDFNSTQFSNILRILWVNLESSTIAHSSRRGSETVLRGVTLDLELTKVLETVLSK